MAVIEFYEKPGCINNTKQKELLIQAGHQVIAKDLLAQNWDKESLESFFEGKAANTCINPVAPAVKKGEINPESIAHDETISKMIQNPILIKRPLLNINGHKFCGWDENKLQKVITLDSTTGEDIVTCPSTHKDQSCGTQQ